MPPVGVNEKCRRSPRRRRDTRGKCTPIKPVVTLRHASVNKGDTNLQYAWFALTSAGFRRITTNCSARCIKKLVKRLQRIVSISSACFTAILTRTLFTLVSMRHFSWSFRHMVTGLRRSSLLDLRTRDRRFDRIH